jgi:hypothetical protein
VAFVDSDDAATPGWTRTIRETLDRHPDVALVSGDRLASGRSRWARAIALNDETIRRLAGGGVMRFAAGNCVVNREVWPDARFDESFFAAEDLEIVSRITGRYRWMHVPELQIHQFSRAGLGGYARQMYRYGSAKQEFAWAFGTYRPLDYVPLALMLAGALGAALLGTWWPLLLIVPFSLAEAVFVVLYRRCSPRTWLPVLAAWLVKNVSWSAGVAASAARLAVDAGLRRRLRVKRSAAAAVAVNSAVAGAGAPSPSTTGGAR